SRGSSSATSARDSAPLSRKDTSSSSSNTDKQGSISSYYSSMSSTSASRPLNAENLNTRLTEVPSGTVKDTPPTTPRVTASSDSLLLETNSTAPTSVSTSARPSELGRKETSSPLATGPALGPPK